MTDMTHNLVQRLREGQRLVGTLVTLPLPEMAEGLARAGFDWLWIDLEHAPLSLREVQSILSTVAGRAHALVRIPDNTAVWIKQVLDLGADGVIVPLVNSAAEARRSVEAAKYPPDGSRSVGIGRAHGHGLSFKSYVERANTGAAVLLQVEHIEGVRNIEEILSVPGVDGILIGPYDLSGSMNLLGQTTHPEVFAAVETVRVACERRGVPVGAFTLSPAEAGSLLARGFGFVAVGIDAHYLLSAARDALAAARSPVSP